VIIACERCKTRFNVPDDKLLGGPVRMRCSKCDHTFVATPASALPATSTQSLTPVGRAPTPAPDFTAPRAPSRPDPFANLGPNRPTESFAPVAPVTAPPPPVLATSPFPFAAVQPPGGATGFSPAPVTMPQGSVPARPTPAPDPFAALAPPSTPPAPKPDPFAALAPSVPATPAPDPFAVLAPSAPPAPPAKAAAPFAVLAPSSPPTQAPDPSAALAPGRPAAAAGPDPFAALAGPARPADPFAMPSTSQKAADPFAALPPSSAAAPDPFSSPPRAADPFAIPSTAAQKAPDPFAAPPSSSATAPDPFATLAPPAPATRPGFDAMPTSDPFAIPAGSPSAGPSPFATDLFDRPSPTSSALSGPDPYADMDDQGPVGPAGQVRAGPGVDDAARAALFGITAPPAPAAPPPMPMAAAQTPSGLELAAPTVAPTPPPPAAPRAPSRVIEAVAGVLQVVLIVGVTILAVVVGRGGSVAGLLALDPVATLALPTADVDTGLFVDDVVVSRRVSAAGLPLLVISGVVHHRGERPFPAVTVEADIDGTVARGQAWPAVTPAGIEAARTAEDIAILQALRSSSPAVSPGERAPFVIVLQAPDVYARPRLTARPAS